MRLLRGLALCAAGAGIAYLAFATARLRAFGRRRLELAPRGSAIGVTVLKPLHGDEPRLFDNLCSFCDQDHDRLQVIFGVAREDDVAIEVARRVIASYPHADVSLVVDPRIRCANRKISNVINMMEHARHDVIVVADSDTRVGRSYARAVLASFSDPAVGAVTCLYRGVPLRGDTAALGALFINDQFAPSALVAAALSPVDFCLGATMAVTRSTLERIGGFKALGSFLADDRMLGRLVYESGLTVALSPYVVEHDVTERDVRELWEHEVRWARTMRSARPYGYAFSFIMHAVPVSALAWAFSRNPLGAILTCAAIAARTAMHLAARQALRVKTADEPWLVPIRDVLGLCLWATAFSGSGVRWRDQELDIDECGRIVRSV